MSYTNINSYNSIGAPLQIPNVAFWLDASDTTTITLSNTTVTQWADKITGTVGINTGAPSYNTDSNGRSFIRFGSNGSIDYFNFGNTLLNIDTQPFSIFAVARNNSNGIEGIIGRNTTTPHWWFGFNGSAIQSQYITSGGTINNFTGAITGTSTCNINLLMLDVTRTASLTTEFNYQNGSNIGGTSAALTSSAGSFPLNVGRGINTFYLNGDIFEIIAYVGSGNTSPFYLQQRQYIEGYLAWKWGIQTILATSHPYRNAAPNNYYNYVVDYSSAISQTQFTLFTNPNNPFSNIQPTLPAVGPTITNLTTGFSPLSIPGLALWLDAGDQTTVLNPGTSNMVWVDKSGGGRNAIVGLTPNFYGSNSFGAYPTYYQPGTAQAAVQTYSNALISQCNISVAQYSFFILAQSLSPIGSDRAFFSIASSYNQPYNSVDAFEIGIYLNIAASITPTILYGSVPLTSVSMNFPTQTVPSPSTNPFPITFLSVTETSTASVNLFTNGAPGNSINGTSVRSNTGLGYALSGEWVIRNGGLAGTNLGAFNYSEVILYSNVLTTAQRQQVEGYLAWKWGLTSRLPSGHQNQYMPP